MPSMKSMIDRRLAKTCISLSTKQGNSGRIAVTWADWIMSLEFSFPVRFFNVPFGRVCTVIWSLDPFRNHPGSATAVSCYIVVVLLSNIVTTLLGKHLVGCIFSSLVCGLCLGLLARPFCVSGRVYSVIVAFPGHLQYYRRTSMARPSLGTMEICSRHG